MANATLAIIDRESRKRHAYCARCFAEALAQAPLNADEVVRRAKKGERCEECPGPGKTEK